MHRGLKAYKTLAVQQTRLGNRSVVNPCQHCRMKPSAHNLLQFAMLSCPTGRRVTGRGPDMA